MDSQLPGAVLVVLKRESLATLSCNYDTDFTCDALDGSEIHNWGAEEAGD